MARSSSPRVRGLAGACRAGGGSPGFTPYGKPTRRAPAASRKVRRIQWSKRSGESVWERPLRSAPILPRPHSRNGRATVSQSGGFRHSRGRFAHRRLRERLELANIFVPEREQAVVHLAQGVEKHRNVDVLVV